MKIQLNGLPHGQTLGSYSDEHGGFLSVEVQPVARNEDPDTGETDCQVTDRAHAEIWSVYARYDCEGDALAVLLHDADSEDGADSVAFWVSVHYGIPCNFYTGA